MFVLLSFFKVCSFSISEKDYGDYYSPSGDQTVRLLLDSLAADD